MIFISHYIDVKPTNTMWLYYL